MYISLLNVLKILHKQWSLQEIYAKIHQVYWLQYFNLYWIF